VNYPEGGLPLLERRAEPFRWYYDQWRAGVITDDELRSLVIWLQLSFGSALIADPLIEMLRATGYATDSPGMVLPERFPIYQGRSRQQQIGIAWTPNPALGIEYARGRMGRTGMNGVLFRGVVACADVLAWSRLSSEVIVETGRIEDLQYITPRHYRDVVEPDLKAALANRMASAASRAEQMSLEETICRPAVEWEVRRVLFAEFLTPVHTDAPTGPVAERARDELVAIDHA
jgi:hypothetical protein